MFWFDQMQYGTPTQEQNNQMGKQTYLDGLFAELSSFPPPKNSSDPTRDELNELVKFTKQLNDNPQHLHRYVLYDRALVNYFHEGLSDDPETNEKIKSLAFSVIQDSSPLLLKLKYLYNRPRPRQLAAAYRLKMFPHTSKSDNSPSYPSGHVFQARLLCEVIGSQYPKSYGMMMKLLSDISYSRLYLGVHYQSDIDSAMFFSGEVLKNHEFKLKYSL